MARAALIALCTFVRVATAPFDASAEPAPVPSRVAIALPRCDKLPFESQAFIELLRIELGADGVTSVAFEEGDRPSEAAPLARIAVDVLSCNRDDAHVVLTVFDRLTDKSTGRGLDLAPMDPKARARFVALAAAELLRASWLELAANRRAMVPESVMRSTRARIDSFVGPRPTPEPLAADKTAAAAPAAATWLGVAGTVRAFPAAQSAIVGPSVTSSFPIGATDLRLGGHFGTGEGYDVLGTVALGMASGSVSWMARTRNEGTVVAVGPRVEAGYGWVRGDAAGAGIRGASGGAFVALGGMGASLRGPFSARWACSLSLDGGLALASVEATADNRRTVGLRGPYAGVALGLELLP